MQNHRARSDPGTRRGCLVDALILAAIVGLLPIALILCFT